MAAAALARLGADREATTFREHITVILADLMVYEGWFAVPDFATLPKLSRSELWQVEDQLKRVAAIVDELDTITELTTEFTATMFAPLVADHPRLLAETANAGDGIPFSAHLLRGAR